MIEKIATGREKEENNVNDGDETWNEIRRLISEQEKDMNNDMTFKKPRTIIDDDVEKERITEKIVDDSNRVLSLNVNFPSPESKLIKKEHLEECLLRVGEMGDDYLEIFRGVLDNMSFNELSAELNIPKRTLMFKLNEILSVLDSSHKVPSEKSGYLIKDKKGEESVSFNKNGGDLYEFDENLGRIVLKNFAKEMSLDVLCQKLKENGFSISRAKVAKAKKNGFFFPEYSRGNLMKRAKFVVLNEAELIMTPQELVEKFGFNSDNLSVARKALERGYFEVSSKSQEAKVERLIGSNRIKSGFVGFSGGGRGIYFED